MEKIKRFFRQSLMSFKGLFGWLDLKVYILVKVLNPIFTVIFFSMLARYVYHSDDVTPYIIGNAMVLSFYNAIFGVGNVLSTERFFGTLKIVAVAPMNNFLVFISRGFFHIIDGMGTILISFLAGALLFGLSFQGSYLQLMIIFLISTYSVFGLGLIITSLGLKYRDMNLIMNISAMILLACTGANFPISKFPVIIQNLTKALPLTRGITAARLTSAGIGFDGIIRLLASEFILGTFFVFIGYLMFAWMSRLARRDGRYDFY